MSDEGGIGVSLPRVDGVAERPRVERRSNGAANDGLAETVAQLQHDSREMREGIEAAAAKISEQETTIAQLHGQIARMEAVLPQYQAAFQQLDAKMTALAQQVMRNTRYAVLDLATKSRQPGEPAGNVVKNAETYRLFMEPPAPPQPAAAPDGVSDDAPSTTH